MSRWCVLLLLAFLCPAAFAEGRCPPGMYPIHAVGVAACAPIPKAKASAPASTFPRPVEVSTWGAIATEADSGKVGTAILQLSEKEARDLAVARCNEQSITKRCEIISIYSNQCGALAWGNDYASSGSGLTPELASFHALNRCERGNGGFECKVYVVECSMPIRR